MTSNDGPVSVETILFGIEDGRLFYWHVTRPWIPLNGAPEVAVVSSSVDGTPPRALTHSTSWRFVEPSEIILTFAVVPFRAEYIYEYPVQEMTGPCPLDLSEKLPPARFSMDQPSRVLVPQGDIARHAARHISWLMRYSESLLEQFGGSYPEFWLAFEAFSPEPAGQLTPSEHKSGSSQLRV